MDVPCEVGLPCGKVALVSAEDWRRVSRMSWSDGGCGYIRARNKKAVGGDGEFVYLHRYIMSAPAGYVVDHIDGNPLNNTRENLQVITHSRNAMRAFAGGTISMARSRFRARMRVDGRMVSLGCYSTRQEAQAVLEAARRMVWTNPNINSLGVIP